MSKNTACKTSASEARTRLLSTRKLCTRKNMCVSFLVLHETKSLIGAIESRARTASLYNDTFSQACLSFVSRRAKLTQPPSNLPIWWHQQTNLCWTLKTLNDSLLL